MGTTSSVELRVYPDDCDSFGHLNQAAFLRFFEHARWERVTAGPGFDVFTRSDSWPAARKTSIEYFAGVFPGDVLRIDMKVTQAGRTSFTLLESARRVSDDILVAKAEFVFVCIDRSGKPTPVPQDMRRFLEQWTSVGPVLPRHLRVRGLPTAVDVQGDGPDILFVHGFPLDRTMWHPLGATLTGWRRIAPDLRGFGLSDVPDEKPSMAEFADDLAALLTMLGVERTVLCGLSMGGYVAFEMVRRHPDRIRGLILANTRSAADGEDAKRQRDATIRLVGEEGTRALSEKILEKLFATGSLDTIVPVVEKVRSMITGNRPDGMIGALHAMRDRADSTSLLSEITVPTLVVAGREDQLIPVGEMRTLAAAIDDAQFAIIPDAGHLAPLEQPVATSRVIAEFLEALR